MAKPPTRCRAGGPSPPAAPRCALPHVRALARRCGPSSSRRIPVRRAFAPYDLPHAQEFGSPLCGIGGIGVDGLEPSCVLARGGREMPAARAIAAPPSFSASSEHAFRESGGRNTPQKGGDLSNRAISWRGSDVMPETRQQFTRRGSCITSPGVIAAAAVFCRDHHEMSRARADSGGRPSWWNPAIRSPWPAIRDALGRPFVVGGEGDEDWQLSNRNCGRRRLSRSG